MAWVAIFVVLGKVAGAAKEMAVAWRYGVNATVDVFELSSTMVLWLPGTMVSASTPILVTMLVRLAHGSINERKLFIAELQGSVVVLGIILSGVCLIIGQLARPLFGANLSDVSLDMVRFLTLVMAPLTYFSLALGVLGARLMAQKLQVNTLLEGVPALVILLFVLLWPTGDDVGPLLWGMVFGMFAHAVWAWGLANRADGASVLPRFALQSSQWPEFYKAFGVMAAGQFVMSFIVPLDQFTAIQLGEGSVATLGYANRLMALLIGVGAVAIARGALPTIAELQASNNAARAREVALKWAALLLVAGIFVVIAGWALAPWMVRILFERGAFTAEDTQSVVDVFRYGLLQLPFYFSGIVLVQLLASQRRYTSIAFFAGTNFLVKLVLNPMLTNAIGLSGITLATSAMLAWSTFCLYCVVLLTRSKF
jgi:putative peptidoglycan lipid II flippase